MGATKLIVEWKIPSSLIVHWAKKRRMAKMALRTLGPWTCQPMLILAFSVLAVGFTIYAAPIDLTIDDANVVAKIPPYFVSFGWEMDGMLGCLQVSFLVFTLERMNEPRLSIFGPIYEPLEPYVSLCVQWMNDPLYSKIASHMSPAIVRVGGITGDWVHYDLSNATAPGVQGASLLSLSTSFYITFPLPSSF